MELELGITTAAMTKVMSRRKYWNQSFIVHGWGDFSHRRDG